LDWLGALKREGLNVNGQVGCRPIGILMGFETSVHPFASHPAWKAMAELSPAMRIETLLNDAALRHELISHRPDDPHTRWMDWALDRSFELDDELDYEPAPERSIAGRARDQKWQLALDIMLKNSGTGLILYPFENYTAGSLEVIREMLLSEHTVCGLGDAGAHVATICDASYPTFLITHWGRDRTRGERIPLEFLVHKQTRATALAYGLRDRGLIAPGHRADLNMIDLDNLTLEAPSVSYDLPAGGRRLVQRASGYIRTFNNGVCTMINGSPTGALPGALIRGSR
jgi:N-acyl-D-aspartate/D-glutamate deacylase